MKKLLSILGTITIAGSGISGIVGNAPAPEKNEINYLQTNNLEKLKRNFNFIDKYLQGKKPLLNIGICKNTVLLKTQQNQGFIEISILIYKIKEKKQKREFKFK